MRTGIMILTFACSAALGGYEIRDYSFSDGYAVSAGAEYQLYGTTTQADPGTATGGSYAIDTGYFAAAVGCTVDLYDLRNFAAMWLLSGSVSADLNSDGAVNTRDFADLARYWLAQCPGGWELK
jgi:hypothetical protein